MVKCLLKMQKNERKTAKKYKKIRFRQYCAIFCKKSIIDFQNNVLTLHHKNKVSQRIFD